MSAAERMSADERREMVLKRAVVEFARLGLHGASTVAIAEAAGVSQPYLFRLFGTKKKLFLAAVARVFDEIMAAFNEAVSNAESDAAIQAMGQAYRHLLQRRYELLLLLQSFAASDDAEIQAFVRARYHRLHQLVAGLTAADSVVIQAFMAKGALLTMATAVQLPELAHEEEWVKDLLQ